MRRDNVKQELSIRAAADCLSTRPKMNTSVLKDSKSEGNMVANFLVKEGTKNNIQFVGPKIGRGRLQGLLRIDG